MLQSNLVFFDGWDGSYMLSNDSSTYHGATAGSSCGSAVTFSVEYLKAEAQIMLQFLPQVAAVLNAQGKAPIFSSECSAALGSSCDCFLTTETFAVNSGEPLRGAPLHA